MVLGALLMIGILVNVSEPEGVLETTGKHHLTASRCGYQSLARNTERRSRQYGVARNKDTEEEEEEREESEGSDGAANAAHARA